MKKILIVLGIIASVGASGQCWKMISAGLSHNMAIKNDGTLWAWGHNLYGYLGVGDLLDRNQPTQIGNDNNWLSVSASFGWHTVAVKTNGTLWAWGNNFEGQLGNGTYIQSKLPVQIGSDTNWKMASAGGNYCLAIKKNGTLWCWGSNNFYQLGIPNSVQNSNIPIQYDTAINWQSVYAGNDNIFALKTDSTLWGWGSNFNSQLGIDNTTTYIYSSLVQIDSNSKWRSIEVKYHHSAGIKKDGSLWTWGNNLYGQIGDSSLTTSFIPKQIGINTDWKYVSVGWGHTMGIRNNGTLWSWGDNNWGSLGNGSTISKYYPIRIGNDANWSFASAGHSYSIALKSNGDLWSWGANGQGELGDGTLVSKYLPTRIICPVSTLPLKLLSFTAKQQTPNSVALNWQTSNEVNVSHFNIQRSNNGKDFTSIGKVNASCCSYEFTDQLTTSHLPLPIYYRLEMVDKDGSKTYSEIKRVTLNEKQETKNIILFPNPAKDIVTIECLGAKEILIIDNLGRIIKQFNNPTEHQTLNAKQMAKGIFIVKAMMNNGDIKTEKLVVE